jgi:hypothetical protein
MKALFVFLLIALLNPSSFAAGSFFSNRTSTPKCIVAVELNDLDFNNTNRWALKSALSAMGFEFKEFFIDNKDQLNRDSNSLSAVRLLDYGPRPGINEDAPYVGQQQISLIVPKSTDASTGNPSRMTYNIQVYTVKNVQWTVSTDELGNKQARFHGDIEKASAPIEIGKRIVTEKNKLPSGCDFFGKGKVDLINPEICSKVEVDEPVTNQAALIRQLTPYLQSVCR